MCRLFGFRSVLSSAVHRSLLEEENALRAQSTRHPDGWGVAYYAAGAPHVVRSADAAATDSIFQRVAGLVSSNAVIAHVRKATVGSLSVLNAHPFQHGRWVFAHNGEIPGFDRFRAAFVAEVAPELRGYILGDTDSEVLFFLFLGALSRRGPLDGDFSVEDVAAAVAEVEARALRLTAGAVSPEAVRLNFLVTNGALLAASRRGRELWWSSHKGRCGDRARCSALAPACEAPSRPGSALTHLLVSSEPLGSENVWREVPEGGVVGVDARMRLALASTRAQVPLRADRLPIAS